MKSSFSSKDEAEVTEFIRQLYADNQSRFAPIRDGAHFSALTHDVPGLGADRVRTSIDYAGTSTEGFHDYVFVVVHAGSVQVAARGAGTRAGRGDVAFYPLKVPVAFTMRGFDVTTLRLPHQRIVQVAEKTACRQPGCTGTGSHRSRPRCTVTGGPCSVSPPAP